MSTPISEMMTWAARAAARRTRTQRLPPQRPHRVHPCGKAGQVRIGEELVEEFRAQCADDLHGAGQGCAQELGEPGPLYRCGLGEQLLELVDHDQ
jgi:hypothetical protein